MSEFEREQRYAVIKFSHLTDSQKAVLASLGNEFEIPSVEAVVVEADWPEYEAVWRMIERRMAGLPDELSAAQSELTALREELANAKEWSGRLDKRCVALATDKDTLIDRCKASEQRNATLEAELRNIRQSCELSKLRDARIDELLYKPTESGASE